MQLQNKRRRARLRNRATKQAFIDWAVGTKQFETVNGSLCIGVVEGELRVERESTSKCNLRHLFVDLLVAKRMIRAGIEPSQTLFLTVYGKQTRMLRHLLHQEVLDIEVKTIDDSQSRERLHMIVDLVTPAQYFKQLGFVGAKQRLNVALSRALDGRVVICGDDMRNIG
jgi:hypothetical protein